MDVSLFLLLFTVLQISPLSSSSTSDTLTRGSSLSVEKTNDALISANGFFTAGFFPVGPNAFCFAIWITSVQTVVWMANRDEPVNGRSSKLTLLKNGNLILTDADRTIFWSTDTVTVSKTQLQLLNSGNLVLRTSENIKLWHSFDSPTDTLLAGQELSRNASLISSRSRTDYSTGYYKLYFDNDNVIRLLFNGQETTSIYWLDPLRRPWQDGRSTYNSSRIATFSPDGHFKSTDDMEFDAADYGVGPLRRLTLDPDGNTRLYSLDEKNLKWVVSWQVISQPCIIHGVCGPNGLCIDDPVFRRRCFCLKGFKMKDPTDFTQGCEQQFNYSCDEKSFKFIHLRHVEFYGYDTGYFQNFTLQKCKEKCAKLCSCRGFQFKFNKAGTGVYDCYPKTQLLNGRYSPNFDGDLYLKYPRFDEFSERDFDVEMKLDCPRFPSQMNRTYEKIEENKSLRFLLWFATAVGGIELTGILLVWCFLFKAKEGTGTGSQRYVRVATGLRKFSYAELKKATSGFSEEIGRGGGGVVYKAILSDQRVAAIKKLNDANQGEAEFLAEVSTIGTINHMNLIELWGYCTEGKHRLLVYEFMEGGSLAENLISNALDWDMMFEIAMGTAKGLAYFHDECLEWILHCDIKPHNILLDAHYRPKVADFGLSKLLNRGGMKDMSFSRIRGTRGYMAPEWVYNLPITSKVDVYSYGIVVLEMVTGKNPTIGVCTVDCSGSVTEHGRLVTWVREKMNEAAAAKKSKESWIEEIMDPMIASQYDVKKMEVLVRVALQCVQEERDARPTMSQVVEMLLCDDDKK